MLGSSCALNRSQLIPQQKQNALPDNVATLSDSELT